MTLVLVLIAAGALGYLGYRAIPDHRTAFLVDASITGGQDGFGAIAAAVGSAAGNAGDGDALSLRRFGGACATPGNTAEVVSSGVGQGGRIAAAARALTPGGRPTLESGVLATIDDFSGFYPFRGRQANRVIVVTRHGHDACTGDQAEVLKAIRDRIAAAGLTLEFRFVGYQVPADQKDDLARLSSAVEAPAPHFAKSPDDLTLTLRRLTVPEPPDASRVQVPDTPTPKPKKVKKWDFVISLATVWGVTVTGAPVACSVKTNASGGSDARICTFKLAEGERIRLKATITGPDPRPERARNNPYYRPFKTPLWYGCDEGPASRSCTVTMSKERIAKRYVKSGPTGLPWTSLTACVTTQDPAGGGLAFSCAATTGASPTPMPTLTYADGSVDPG
ncbi:hypothetical protein [Nonomuraea sp. NPDC050691]|uniref:hypothetical protein n=1 Tax=Nonomuraea sp. NPDC050691 TaxID=3155661 RepID=UPI0033F644E0